MTPSSSIKGNVRQWKQYPAYRKTDVPWLQEIPSSWKPMRLKFVVSKIGSGKTPKGGGEVYRDAGVVFLRSQNVHFEGLRLDDVAYIDEETDREMTSTRVRAKDVLLNITGASLGRCSLVADDAPAANVNQHVCILRPRLPLIEPGFLNASIASHTVQAQIFSAENGVSREGLNYTQTGNLYFALPSTIDEQRSIVAFLGRETMNIDALLAKKERLIELLQEKRTALISHAVTTGLDPKVPMKDSGVRWLGKIPTHWGIIQSRRVFEVRNEPARESDEQLTASQKYGMLPQTEFMELEGRRVVVTIKGVESLRHVEPSDFVISLRSFQGGIEWCKIPGSVTFHYVVLKSVKTLHPAYFGYLFKSSVFIQALRATTDFIRDGQDLRYSNFILVPLPVVPLEEQAAIASFLDRETAKLDSLVSVAQQTIDKLREYRTALISAAVTGKIDVREEIA